MRAVRAVRVAAVTLGALFAALPAQSPAAQAAAAGARVTLAVTLKLHRPVELMRLIRQQTDPDSPLYAHFLTAAEFRATYAPTAQEYTSTIASLQRAGFAIDRTTATRMLVDVSADPQVVERTFGVHVTHAVGANASYVADHAAVLPAALSAVAAVVGLESNDARALVGPAGSAHAPAVLSASDTVGPDNGFAPNAVLRGFDYPLAHGFNGSGATVANLIDGATDRGLPTFLDYFHIAARLPHPTVIAVNGGLGEDAIAADAAVEWLYATAPGAHVLEYDIPNLANANIVDALEKIAADNLADVVNISFGACETDTTFAFAVLPIVAQSAAQGISVESVAFGGAARCGIPGIALTQTPADSADGLAVGGVNVIEDAAGSIVATSAYIGSGGGVSLLVPVPASQRAVRGVDPAGRNVPDLAMSASINGTGPSFNFYGFWLGGNPFVNNSAVGGMLADFNQMTGHRLGAFDNTLYAEFGRLGYGAVFNDVTVGCNGLISGIPVCAKPGYDTTSGIGAVDAYRLGARLR